jgi:ketosteroid isomerase-like protein
VTSTTDRVIDYPAEPDTRHASAGVVRFLDSFFAAKNRHDVAETMVHFSPDVVTYTESILGWPIDGFDAIEQTFAQHMPTWPETALSYPTRILGGDGSVLVAFTDMPELFGAELRLLGAIDFKDGKIVRWVDYWDSTIFDDELYSQMKTPAEHFPTSFHEDEIPVSAAPEMVVAGTRLQALLAGGDAAGAAALFSYDVVFEDMALRMQLQGRSMAERYLAASLPSAPYGVASSLRHIVGGPTGGGVEWIAPDANGVAGGITALELDSAGLISRVTAVYDGRLLATADREVLVANVLGVR